MKINISTSWQRHETRKRWHALNVTVSRRQIRREGEVARRLFCVCVLVAEEEWHQKKNHVARAAAYDHSYLYRSYHTIRSVITTIINRNNAALTARRIALPLLNNNVAQQHFAGLCLLPINKRHNVTLCQYRADAHIRRAIL